MEGIVQAFKIHLARLGYSPGSQQMLPACVAEFLQHTGKPLERLHARDIIHYHDYLQQRPNRRRAGGLSEMMIHHHLYALRVLFIYLEQTGQIAASPMSGLLFPQPQHGPRAILPPGDIQRLFDQARTLREKALLHLCYSCGLRRNEAVQLNVRDIHFRNRLLYVRSGKGAKRRVIPLTEKVSEELKLYYEHERPELASAVRPTEAFILSVRGGRLQGCRMNTLLKALTRQAGIVPSISLHNLRHSIATHLLANGLPVEQVRDFLGHAHLESTQLYTRIDPQQLQVWNSATI
jgi:integrase/recombinase XerD